MKRYHLFFILLLLINVLLCIMLICMVHSNHKLMTYVASTTNSISHIMHHKTVVIDTVEPLTLNSAYETILSYDIDNPMIVLAQAVLESGWFQCHTYNNLFGMSYPKVRCTTALFTSPDNYAHYSSWEESILDYKYYQDYNNIRGLSEEEYLNYLQVNYASDPQYSKKLKSLIKSFKSYNI